jgi:hypothetical protein
MHKVVSLELIMGMSVFCNRLHVRHLYGFSFGEEHIGRQVVWHHTFILHQEANHENQEKLKNFDSKSKS